MVGEDFGEYRLADPEHVQSLIFRVGAQSPEVLDAAKAKGGAAPSLHSSKFAPVADKAIATAAEALAVSALDLMRRQP